MQDAPEPTEAARECLAMVLGWMGGTALWLWVWVAILWTIS